jgi:demethylmenaquinone methyltransferase/2-methoxy-6-polyprenyl-1,4-benzoquinol methylase
MVKKDIALLFDDISPRYDLSNTIISMGFEKIWRRHFLKQINSSNCAILDACCGSGTSTSQIGSKAKKAKILGIDISEKMISIARDRYKSNKNLVFSIGDINSLDLKSNSFDCITIVFGIRNVPERKKALKELKRVVKDGGKIIILEFNHIKNGIFGHLFRFYLYRILPIIGGMLTGKKGAYTYLSQSIRDFPDPGSFLLMMKRSGWKNVEQISLTGGICKIFIGY